MTEGLSPGLVTGAGLRIGYIHSVLNVAGCAATRKKLV